MKQLSFLALLGIAVLFGACQKQPTAGFSTDKDQYTAGETVMLTNESIDAKKYLWSMPDGSTSTTEDAQYVIPEDFPGGDISFTLEAMSKNGKLADTATATVNVVGAIGQVVVWSNRADLLPIMVAIDNIPIGSITSAHATEPACGTPGTVTTNLKVGSHYVAGSSGSTDWLETVVITKNSCAGVELQ